jgi:hypothetical protein
LKLSKIFKGWPSEANIDAEGRVTPK